MEQPHNPVYGDASPILTHPRLYIPILLSEEEATRHRNSG